MFISSPIWSPKIMFYTINYIVRKVKFKYGYTMINNMLKVALLNHNNMKRRSRRN